MLKKLFITTVFGLVGLQFAPASVQAGLFDPAKEDACAGSQVSSTAPDCSAGSSSEVDTLIQNIVNIISLIVGIIAVIMIIINGLRFITSGGDANSVSSARNGVIYAVVGLILVGMAQFIVRFVLARTG